MGIHGRPSKTYTESLRPLTQEDCDNLLMACVETIVTQPYRKVRWMHLSASYLTKFPKDFPRRYLVEDKGEIEIFKVDVRKVLIWLNKHSYTSLTMDSLWRAQLEYKMGLAFLNEKEYDECVGIGDEDEF